jgi:DNA-binding CsgD family transcriptional regulator
MNSFYDIIEGLPEVCCTSRPLPMISSEELSKLLGSLYAAPLQPEKWQVFFDHLSRLIKVSSGYLITGNESQGQEILAGGGSRFNPEVLQLYREHYGPMDPFWAPFLRNPRIAIIRGEELVRREQLVKTEFYNDLLTKYDMDSMTLLSCSSNVNQTDIMSVWRPQDHPMEEESIALLRTLLPHANTALQLRARLQATEIQSPFAETVLDSMSIAAFLVSANGYVHHRNKLAETFVQQADGLRIDGTILTASSHSENARLHLFISGAALAGQGKNLLPGGALAIARHGTQPPLRVAVLPVPENHRSLIRVPCALVFVSDPAASPKSRAVFIRMLYGLTPAESRLADLLLEGLELRGVAERLGLTIHTARFHLKRVLTKTGTRRQTELMRLMLSLPGIS